MLAATIADRVSRRASRRPQDIAVDDGTVRLTFAELEGRVAAAADALRERGLEPGDRVGLCVQRSASMVVLLLAVLRSRAAYVALDPTHPRARHEWVLDDVGPRFVVTCTALSASLPRGAVPLLAIEDLTAPVADPCPEPMPARSTTTAAPGLPHEAGADLAFITYTSGTTGRPKGVMHVNESACYVMDVLADYLRIGPGTRFLSFYPLTWETHILEIFTVLAAGGTVIIAPADHDIAGPDLVDLLHRASVTHAMLPPALLAELVERPTLPCLTTLAYIGEVCRAEVAERWGRGRRLVNLYGPTEVTVVATASDVREPGRAPLIGRPLPGRRVYVLDADQQPVAGGSAGELYVGGRGLARGYWRLPELTARAFPADPFDPRPGARMYRTGDLVRRTPGGELDFLGRVDDQLSVRGQRVERGEVEAALGRHAGVRASAVVVQGDGAAARLVAFVVADPDVAPDLATHAAAQLPPVMVPSAFVHLDRLPLNQHGKIDLRELSRLCPPSNGAPASTDGPAPSADAVDAGLRALWREVLDVPAVDVRCGFRALGGTSLQAVRAAVVIEDRFGVRVSVRELLGAGALEEIAELVRAAPSVPATTLPALVRSDLAAPYRATSHQRRLWAMARMRPVASAAYNETSVLQLDGPLDVPALRAAVQDLADRHEALRSSFRLDGPELVVDVGDRVLLDLATEDVDPVGAQQRPAQLGAQPLDLARAPVARAVLLRQAELRHLLVLVVHHTLVDGLSLDLLDADLDRCYSARVAGHDPAPVSQDEVRPRDHSAWQRALENHPAADAGLAHWVATLTGAPTELDLVPQLQRPRVFSHRGGRVSGTISAAGRAAVEGLARRYGSSPYGVCLLALAVLLTRRTGRREVLIGSPYAGRPGSAAESAVSFFTNTVVMRVAVDRESGVGPLLARIEHGVQSALQHQYVEFGEVVRALGATPGPAGQPLVQAVMAYQGAFRPHAHLDGVRVTPLRVDTGLVKADLTVEVEEEGNELVVVVPYASDVMTNADAETLLEEYLTVVQELVDEGAGDGRDV